MLRGILPTLLLLHCDSHVDKQYKSCLIKTIIYRAYRLSFTPEALNSECAKLGAIFSKLGYPSIVIESCVFYLGEERKPDLAYNQCVGYHFKCNQCDSDYVGFTTRHWHQRIQEHRYSVTGKYLINIHGIDTTSLSSQFSLLKKC